MYELYRDFYCSLIIIQSSLFCSLHSRDHKKLAITSYDHFKTKLCSHVYYDFTKVVFAARAHYKKNQELKINTLMADAKKPLVILQVTFNF